MKKILLLSALFLLGISSAHAQFPNGGWFVKTAMPSGRGACGPASYQTSPNNGMLVPVGGWDAGFAITTNVSQFNTSTNIWNTALPTVPQGRIHARAFYNNNKIYYIGGYSTGFSPVNTVNIFDVATNTWSTGAPMIQAVGDYASAQYGDYIYIMCGYSGAADVTAVQVYNTVTNTWASCTPFNGTAVGGGRAGIAKGKIVFVGGYSQTLASTQSQARLGTIDPTNPTIITWTALPNYPGGTTGRFAAGSAKTPLATAVYFTAGDPNGSGLTTLNSTWAYDVVAGQWQSGPNKPTGVSNIVSLDPLVVNDTLFFACIGGYNGSVLVTANEWLKIGRASGIPTTIAGTATKCYNTADTLNAVALDTNLRWQSSPNNVTFTFIAGPQGTNDTLFTGNLTATTYFRAVSYGFVDSAISPSFLVTVIDTVKINTQPVSSAVCQGSGATFTVAATGAGATYVWRKGGIPLSNTSPFSGVNTPTLNISDATGQGGSYDVVVTGTCNVKTSTAATLTVNPYPTETITSGSALLCDGASTNITITFTGTPPYNFTYFNGVVPTNVIGHATNTFIYSVTPTTQTTYYVSSITDGNGCSAISSGLSSTVTVDAKLTPVITVQPVDVSVCSGSSTAISTTVTGDVTSYTWYNGNTVLSNGPVYTINNNVLNINNASGLNGLMYHVRISGLCGSPFNSDTVTLTETFTNTWDGSDNTLWSDADNWSCGGIPTVNTDVIIPAGTPFMPQVDIPSAICKSINMAAGATLTYTGSNSALEVKGMIVHNGGMNGTGGKLILSGTALQNVPNTTYKDLTVMGGSIKTMDGDVTITGILNLVNGRLQLNNNDLTLDQPTAQLGGGSSAFIATNTSGKVIANNMGAVGGNPDPVMFHVGKDVTSYTPITLENLGDVDTFSVSVKENVYADGTGVSSLQVTNPVVDRTWFVEEKTAGGSIVNMSPYWNTPTDEINAFSTTHVFVAHYYNGEWISYVDSANGAPAATPAGPGMLMTTQDSIVNFSPFTVASSGQFPLAIRLSSITATNVGPRNKVQWKSETEDAGDSYELESSADGKKFTKIATVAGNGKASTYMQWDNNPVQGVNYYRVKLLNIDGSSSYSKVVTAKLNGKDGFSIEAYPNPVKNTVSVKVDGVVTGKATVVITDVTGKVVKAATQVLNNGAEINVTDLANGIYLLNYTDDVRNESIKINKQ